jgi:hypothetical protein
MIKVRMPDLGIQMTLIMEKIAFKAGVISVRIVSG